MVLGVEHAQLARGPLDVGVAGGGEQRGRAVGLRRPHGDVEAFLLAQLLAVELLEQPSVVHDADAVGQVGDLGEDVARHEDGDAALACQRAKQLADLDDAGRVQRVGRLVQDEQVGVVQQRPGQREPLPVAEREHAGATVGVVLEVHEPDGLADRLPRRSGQPALDLEVLAHGEVGVGGRALDEVADAAEDLALARTHPPAEHLDVAGARADEAEQHADRGRLAGAVPAEEPVDLAAPDRQVERVDGAHVAVALGEAVRGDGGVGAHGAVSS